MSDVENESGETARTDALELEAVRRVLETSAHSKQKERERYPVSTIPAELEAVRAELESPPEAGSEATATAPTNGRAILTEEERDELRQLLARPDRDNGLADHGVRGLRDNLTARYERLATLTRPNDDRSLLFALDKEEDHELLITRLDPRLAHETQTEGQLQALVRKLKRLDHPALAQPTAVSAADDGAPLVAWDLPSGSSLGAEVARRGAFRPPHALAIAQNLVRVLDDAHRANLVHGALNLENVWLLENVPWTDSNPHGVGLQLLEFGFGAWSGGDIAARQSDDVRAAARIFYQLLVGTAVEGDVVPSSELRGLPDRWGRLLERALAPEPAAGMTTTQATARGCGDATSFLLELERLEDAPMTTNERWKIAAGVFFLTTCGALSWKLASSSTNSTENTVLAGEPQTATSAEDFLQLEARLSAKRDELVRARSLAAASDAERDALSEDVVLLERELVDLRAGERAAAAVLKANETLTSELALAGDDRKALEAASELTIGELRSEVSAALQQRAIIEEQLASEQASAQTLAATDAQRLKQLTQQLQQSQARHEALALNLDAAQTELLTEAVKANAAVDQQAKDAETLDAVRERLANEVESGRDALAAANKVANAELDRVRTLALEAEMQTRDLGVELQRSVEQQHEVERLRRAESARGHATTELLQARVRLLFTNVRESQARGTELEAEIEQLKSEGEALRQQLEQELERRIVKAVQRPFVADGAGYAMLVAEFTPLQQEQVNADELDRMRALLNATTAENAALVLALAERNSVADERTQALAQRITELEAELVVARAQSTSVTTELTELDDLRRSRADALRQLEVLRTEVETERTGRVAAAARAEHFEAQIRQLEERWIEREAERATSLVAARLASSDEAQRDTNTAATVTQLQTQVAELQQRLDATRTANEAAQTEISTANTHSAALGEELKTLTLELEEARRAPRQDRQTRRRLAALEAERDSLAEALEDERRTLRRRLQADFEARVSQEHLLLSQELTAERGTSQGLSAELEEQRQAHEAERAQLQEEARELREELNRRGDKLDGERQANNVLERRSSDAELAVQNLEGELHQTTQALETERERSREAIGETIAVRAAESTLRGNLEQRDASLAALGSRFQTLTDDQTSRLEHSATTALAHRIDTLLAALQIREHGPAAELLQSIGRDKWCDEQTSHLLGSLHALNAAPGADLSLVELLDTLDSGSDRLRDARRAWADLDSGTPWLWEPDQAGNPTDRTTSIESLLADAQLQTDQRRAENDVELRRTWRAQRSELHVPYLPATRLARHLDAPITPLAIRLAEAAQSAAGDGPAVDSVALQPFVHLNGWARGFTQTHPFEPATRSLNLVSFARALANGSTLGAAPSPLPSSTGSQAAWFSRSIDLARSLKNPAPGFVQGLRSTWMLAGQEVAVVVKRRVALSDQARLELEVTVDGQPERWILTDRTWARIDRNERVLAQMDLGHLERGNDWIGSGIGANAARWRQFSALSGSLVPRFGPVSWGSGDATLKMIRVKPATPPKGPAVSRLDR